jgi:hypothetical protein
MHWTLAKEYARDLRACDHLDWRLPTTGVLNVMFPNAAIIGGFKTTDRTVAATAIWSAREAGAYAGNQSFIDGRGCPRKSDKLSVRCVRGW